MATAVAAAVQTAIARVRRTRRAESVDAVERHAPMRPPSPVIAQNKRRPARRRQRIALYTSTAILSIAVL
ncbi:hypothetical protein ACFQ9X_29170 [Catenulispora yoronensis]